MMKKRFLSVLMALTIVMSIYALILPAQAAEQLATPKITSVSGNTAGVKISWGAVSGAEKYRVFYKGDTGWKKIADTASTSYTWTGASVGSYTFTVRCVDAAGNFTSNYDTTGTTYNVTAAQLATPKITSVSGNTTGVKIAWGAVSGAAKYRVFYKGDSGWKKIADTTATSYTWTGASVGTYTFTVRCVSADGNTFTSNYDTTGTSYNVPSGLLATPKLTTLSYGSGGMTLSWGAVSGAEKYRVFYKDGSSWKKIADTASTSYTWTDVAVGNTYTFTVRCVDAAGNFTSNYDTTGRTITCLPTPKLSSVSNELNGVTVSWGAVSGAEKYRVFYKTGSGSWTKIADTASTSYTWTGAKSGTAYNFTVRCVSSDGTMVASAFETPGKSITYIAAPSISSLTNTSEGVDITWGAVAGAAKYRVFYEGDSGWKKIADTTATSYSWLDAQPGTTYTFTVRCVDAAGSSFTSNYDTTGKSITYTPVMLDAPELSLLMNTFEGQKLTWSAVPGAKKYRVFFRTESSSSWTKLIDTTSTTYTWGGGADGVTYAYTVACLSSNGARLTSDYAKEYSLTFRASPRITSVVRNYSYVTINWQGVTDARTYYLFYRTENSDWELLTTRSLNYDYYNWYDAKYGTTYYFTVLATDAQGEGIADYDHTGLKYDHLLDTPKISSVTPTSDGIQIKWGSVSNATGYRVFYKTGSNGWKALADLSGRTTTSYTWTGAKFGTTYAFTVRCIDDGGNFTSDYDRTGYTYKYMLDTPNVYASGHGISWDRVDGASMYRVFFKIGDGSWKKVCDVASPYDFSLEKEYFAGWDNWTVYSITVRCVSEDGTTYTSDYDHDGIRMVYLDTPKATWDSSRKAVNWDGVAGAKGYELWIWPSSSVLDSFYHYTDAFTFGVRITDFTPGSIIAINVRAYTEIDGHRSYSLPCVITYPK